MNSDRKGGYSRTLTVVQLNFYYNVIRILQIKNGFTNENIYMYKTNINITNGCPRIAFKNGHPSAIYSFWQPFTNKSTFTNR